MLCCLTVCFLASLQQHWNNSTLRMSACAGQHPDSQHTATIQNQRRGEFNCRTPVHWESVRRTGPLDSVILTHFLCMCLSHYFIFSLWIQAGQQNSDWNVVLATSEEHAQILCCLSLSSQLLTRLSVSSYTPEALWLAYSFR